MNSKVSDKTNTLEFAYTYIENNYNLSVLFILLYKSSVNFSFNFNIISYVINS